MTKLLNLKDWLSISDAARELSASLKEEVSNADILQLALDGKLQMSVRFALEQEALEGKLVPRSKTWLGGTEPFQGSALEVIRSEAYIVSGDKLLQLDDSRTVLLRGVADLPMVGNERGKVEAEYRKATGDATHSLIDSAGTFVVSSDGRWHLLLKERHGSTYEDSDGNLKRRRPPTSHSLNFDPAPALPESSALVVRTSALAHLREAAGAPPDETPQARRKRLANRKQALEAKGLTNPTQQLAEEEGVSTSRIRQLIGGRSGSDPKAERPSNHWPSVNKPTR